MSGFPWGWLLVHLGVGMLFKQEFEKWATASTTEGAGAGAQSLTPLSAQDGAGSESDDEASEEGSCGPDLEDIGA